LPLPGLAKPHANGSRRAGNRDGRYRIGHNHRLAGFLAARLRACVSSPRPGLGPNASTECSRMAKPLACLDHCLSRNADLRPSGSHDSFTVCSSLLCIRLGYVERGLLPYDPLESRFRLGSRIPKIAPHTSTFRARLPPADSEVKGWRSTMNAAIYPRFEPAFSASGSAPDPLARSQRTALPAPPAAAP
jgi:hypothetical protein